MNIFNIDHNIKSLIIHLTTLKGGNKTNKYQKINKNLERRWITWDWIIVWIWKITILLIIIKPINKGPRVH